MRSNFDAQEEPGDREMLQQLWEDILNEDDEAEEDAAARKQRHDELVAQSHVKRAIKASKKRASAKKARKKTKK